MGYNKSQYSKYAILFDIVLQYDGVTNYLHTPFFIDLINSGSLVLPDLEIPVPERFVKPEERQHLYVPGSPEAYVGLVGKGGNSYCKDAGLFVSPVQYL